MADRRPATLALVRSLLERRDAEALAGLVTPDVRWYGNGPGGGCRSRGDVVRTLRDAFAGGLQIKVEDAVVTGRRAVLHLALCGGADGRDEMWLLLEFDDRGAVTQIAEYSSAQAVEHDLALLSDGAGAVADGSGTPPAVSALVPFVHVGDVERSVAFYRHLGFAPADTFESDDILHWAFLDCERAQLMLARAEGTIDHHAQAVLFYLYAQDLAGLRDRLVAGGLAPGEIIDGTPGPKQQMRVADPDGYVLMIAQVEPDN